MDKEQLTALLKRHFGFDQFRPGQLEVLLSLQSGNDTMTILPTGAGKTLIYQMFGLMQSQPILIVSPLLSLMQDQVARLKYLGVKSVVALNSTLNWQQKQAVLANLHSYQYLYISPEMLSQPEVIDRIRLMHPGLVVIDEAHCLSQWGPDFRPDYLNLKSVLEQLNGPLTLMLTATASKLVQSDVINKLGLKKPVNRIIKSIDRPNIYLSVMEVASSDDKESRLLRLVTQLKTPGVIYFLSRKLANQTAVWLAQKTGLRVAAYHSGLGSEDRFKIQHQFMSDQLDIICATSAFGMGIDKNDIRFVIHYHLPANLDAYMQEIGRAGRDGKQSIAILLYQPGDETIPAHLMFNNIPDESLVRTFFKTPKRFIEQSPDDEQIKLLAFYFQHGYNANQLNRIFQLRIYQQSNHLQSLINYVNAHECRRHSLLSYFDQLAPGHNKYCCDYQSNGLPLSDLKLQRPLNQPDHDASLDWQIVIKKLFKNDD
ncbi:ATP-dependent DNA helicase [Nicoliella spurrieriana]|uniref:ATP-dependent DNA helicase n=1 Tax=Nicoliella spurrieriana TaxID=2925830 RepID=A0A976RRS1_9LACO|nr:ATP-dependent DNA helicase RecQ [Nicoliella spurrieriana]UQS86561.1 ATP-dependent DNA helicase [Nicoliella spurrieriana]